MHNTLRDYLSGIGKKGGRVRSPAKTKAARRNGAQGGRPRLFEEQTAYQAMRKVTGGEDWRLAFMNFVDGFRRRPSRSLVRKDPRDLRPHSKMYALLQSICIELCRERGIPAEGWLAKRAFLSKPWFVSGMKNLYAMALKESPVAFRKNNIFVLSNFLSRV